MALTNQKPAMCDMAPASRNHGWPRTPRITIYAAAKIDRNRIMLTRIRRTIADIRSALSPFASAVDRRVVGTLITFFGR
jgi:hypothetical protein